MNETSQTSPEQQPVVNSGRRKLSKAALATPIAASLIARPALACSISGFMSGNTSPGHTYTCDVYSCSPGFWKEHPEIWYSATHGKVSGGAQVTVPNCTSKKPKDCAYWSTTTGTTLKQALALYGYHGNPFGVDADKPLIDLMNDNPGSSVFHFGAALLNAISSPISYGATAQQVVDALTYAVAKSKLQQFINLLADKLEDPGGNKCFLNAHGECNSFNNIQYVFDPVMGCIPKCARNQVFDPITKTCVQQPKP